MEKKGTTAKSYLILGLSNTGKSTAARLIASATKLPVYVIGSVDEFKMLKARSVSIDEDFETFKECVIILDDVLSIARRKNNEQLRLLLNKIKRHKSVTIIVCSHSLNHTGLLGVMHFFDYLWLTKSPASEKDLNLVLKAYKITDFTPEDFRLFCGSQEKWYLQIGLTQPSIDYFDSSLKAISDSPTSPAAAAAAGTAAAAAAEGQEHVIALKKGAEALFRNFENPDFLTSIFNYILDNINSEAVSVNDYCVKLKSKTSDYSVCISLIDFVLTLRDTEKPSNDMYILKKYCDKQFRLPQYFIKNKYFKSRNK